MALVVSSNTPIFALAQQDVVFLDSIIAAKGKSSQADFERLVKVVEANPNDIKARFALGNCFESRGYEQLAADEYKRVCQMQKEHPEAHFKLLGILLQTNDIDAAANEIVACEQLFGKSGKDLLKLGQLVQKFGDVDLAGDIYEEAVKAERPQIGAGTALARVRIEQGKFKEAVDAADKDLALDRDNGKAHAAKGTALDLLNRPRESLREFLIAYELTPYEKGVATKVADELIREKRYAEAVKPAIISQALATETLNELDDAKRVLVKLLDKVPEKDSSRIVEEVSGRVKDDPLVLYFHLSLGEVYQSLGMRDCARRQFEICTTFKNSKIKDQNNPSLISRAYIKLGQIEERQLGNYDRAAAYYREAQKIYPYNMETKDALARLRGREAAKENDLAWDLKEALHKLWETMTGARR